MKKVASALAGWLLLWGTVAMAEEPLPPPIPAEETEEFLTRPVQEEGPVVVYQGKSNFEDSVENLQTAITNRGLLVSKVLYVSDMLNRTGKDLGFPNPVYTKAKSIEFCSAKISHRMIKESPLNLVVCPFTIAVYVKVAEPEKVYLAFQKQVVAGESEAIVEVIHEMLHGIVRETVEMEW